MSLWGNRDLPSGNQKPVFANTSNAWSVSTINGAKANTNKYYGAMFGVSGQEHTINNPHGAHAGWNSQKIGTGPITGLQFVPNVNAAGYTGGKAINANGFILIADDSPYGQGTGANISFVAGNTVQYSINNQVLWSSNSTMNGIVSVTVVNGGSGYSNSLQVRTSTNGSNSAAPSFIVNLGGRGNRVVYETIISMNSITDDDPRDNVYFAGL